MNQTARIHHGTTSVRAIAIESENAFDTASDLYFVMGTGNLDLAELFASRASSRHPNEGGPALVSALVEEACMNRLRKLGMLKLVAFDAEDRHGLASRTQWVLASAGVAEFNQAIEDMNWQPVVPRRQ